MLIETDTIHVAFSADDAYAQHLCVAVVSLLSNLSSGRRVALTVLDGGISPDNRRRIERSLAPFRGKIAAIRFFPVDVARFQEFKETKSISRATYYRIMLPSLLPDVRKIVYLDSDVVVEGDIAELHDTPFDGAHLLAVRDSSRALEKEYADVLRIPSDRGYFNAGVLVMDLEKFRRDDIAGAVVARLREINRLASGNDQPGLNAALHDRWKPLHSRWNLLAGLDMARDCRSTTCGRAELMEAKRDPKLIHYSSRFAKPWLFESVGARKGRYFHYLRMTEFRDFAVEVSPRKMMAKLLHAAYFYCLPSSLVHLVYTMREAARVRAAE